MIDIPPPLKELLTDHDILIELKTEFKLLREDIRDMKDGLKETQQDHEVRIRWLETRGWMLTGGAIALSTLANYLLQVWKFIPH